MSLLADAKSGIVWSAISKIVIHIFQFISLIILARLLEPKEFGLITSSIVVIGFLNIFKDLGISAAIIQKLHLNEVVLNSVYWLVVATGIFMNLMLFILAPIIADFYNSNDLTLILKVLSISFTITSFTIVHQSLFERDLKFKQIAFFEMTSIIIGSISGITFAYLGYGVWSLVFQSLIRTSTLSFTLWFKSSFKPKALFKISELKSVLNFSLNLSGFNILNYFVRNADYILIQKYLGEQQLGFYNIAYRIMLYPLQNITAVFSRVLFPVFAKLQGDHETFKHTYIRFINVIALLSFPLMLWITAAADLLIITLLGEKWIATIPLVLILAPIGLIQSIYTPAGTIFQSTGRTDIWLKWGAITGIIFIGSFVIGLKWGVIGVALAYLFANILTIYPGFYIAFRLIDLKVLNFIKSFRNTFIISFCMFLIAILLKYLLEDYINSIVLLFLLGSVSLIFYILVSIKYNKKNVQEFLSIIKGF